MSGKDHRSLLFPGTCLTSDHRKSQASSGSERILLRLLIGYLNYGNVGLSRLRLLPLLSPSVQRVVKRERVKVEDPCVEFLDYFILDCIAKLWILPIRQIQKFVVLWHDIRVTQCLFLAIASAVLPDRHPADQREIKGDDKV